MTDAIARDYDRTPYPDYAFWTTHPAHTGMMGRLFGLSTASPDRCKVLEIGCAVGGNIVPMAATAPGSQFVGVDLSGVQITRASEAAAAAGVDNLTLIHGDFRDVPERLGPFDYIIAHGVFAWVTPETQAALLAFIGQRLAPEGVAFVSYNAYPGQHMVDMVRKVLAVHTANAPDLQSRMQQSFAVMRFLGRMSEKVENDWRGGFFASELEFMDNGGVDFYEHDYCARESHPVYFVDFVSRATEAGLAYLSDAQPWDMYLDNQAPEIVEALKSLDDIVMQGQYLDFIRHTRYRETLLCRATAPLAREIQLETVKQMHVVQALDAEPTLDGVDVSLPVQVVVAKRPPLTIASPIIRLALHRLWRERRHAPSFDELALGVQADLAAHGVEALEPEVLRERLAAQLVRAFFAQAVSFALRSPPVARGVPERPATGRYQRHMARAQLKMITSLSHEMFEGTPLLHALLPALDGTRTHAELQPLWPDAPIGDVLADLVRKGFVLDPDAAR